MHKTVSIILLLTIISCSYETSDLERMNFNGKINSLKETKTDTNGELIMTKETKFTNSGMVKSTEYIYSFNNSSNLSVNHYDYRNRIVKQEFKMNDSLMTSQDYLHISTNKDSILLFDSNGELINTGTFTYTNDRQTDVINLYNIDGMLVYYDTSTYDNNNRLIKSITEQQFDQEFKRKYQYSYKYDSVGRILQLSTNDSYKDTLTVENFNYKVDKRNNWIEKLVLSEKGDTLGILRREIEYK
nr:hypothetical protein [uncultured Carboxylicivirga sp.]